MRFLSEEQSWNLFSEKVFGQEICPPELEDTGQKIAKNCHGLPLSIVVIGGLLSKENRTQDYWEHVAENLKPIVTENDDRCSKILTLSYDHLPHHLKACFLYMGAFPEDYEIPVSKLIKLWVAEGFLKPRDESELLEEVAEVYLTDLIDRNLILVRQKGSNGKVKTCKMHDLLRELCIGLGQKEKFLYVKNVKSKALSVNTIQQRRLSIHPNVVKDNDASYSFIEDIRETMHSMTGARSLLLIGSYPIEPENHCCFRLLRVLDMAETKLLWFPEEILHLINLRYLAISCENDFPSSISVLRNLQTLIFYSPQYTLTNIVGEIFRLRRLRHLKLSRVFLPFEYFPWNLRTISGIANFECAADTADLDIPNLKKLGIYFGGEKMEVLKSYDSLRNLCGLKKLEKLKLSFESPPDFTSLQHITFPESLKKITLDGCRLPWEFLSIFTLVPNLEVLKLHYAFIGPEWVPTDGEFPKLKFLQIWGTNLVHLTTFQALST